MVFSSLLFIFAFLPITFAVYFLCDKRYRNAILLITSLVFYAWGEPKFVLVMLGSILMNYMAALAIEKMGKKSHSLAFAALCVAILLNLSVLLIFKYLNFVIYNTNLFFNAGIPQTSIALPIGISFFTFQAMSYVIDIYRGQSKAQMNPVGVGLYISFFPQLIAGPIVRYETIAQQIDNRDTTWGDFCIGVERFMLGLFKKVLIANNLAIVADLAFSTSNSELSVCFAWLGSIAYSLQIYFDFCGYSDMAIGLGRMFGFEIPENFNYPYISKSITEFWRRWHISLGTWFRDYVYIPLGGSRMRSTALCIRNLLIVWLLTGIWHGASWNFIAWGLFYFLLLVIEKYIIHPNTFQRKSMKEITWRILTLLSINFGWVLFRAPGLKNGIRYICAMFGLNNNIFIDDHFVYYAREYVIIFIIACVGSTPLFKCIGRRLSSCLQPSLFEMIQTILYLSLFIISVSYLVLGAHNPFIYFNF